MSSKKAFNGVGSIGGYWLHADPVKGGIWIPGVDGGGPEHPMWQPETAQIWKDIQAGKYEGDVQDVMMNGVILPIKVLKDPKTEMAIPVDGRKRTLWVREANRRLAEYGKDPIAVPALIVPRGTKMEEAMLQTLSANSHRYTQTALELADAAAHFIRKNGDSDETLDRLCISLNIRSRERLEKLLKLREADPEILKAATDNRLGVEAALALAQLPVDEQKDTLVKLEEEAKTNRSRGGRVSAERARAAVREKKKGNGTGLPTYSVGKLKRMWKVNEEKNILTDDQKKLLEVIIGKRDPKTVKGLTKLLGGED